MKYPIAKFVGTDEKPEWQLVVPYERKGIIVPERFRYDKASVPRIFWAIIPPFGEYEGAAIIHDWLYHCHGNVQDIIYTKAHADKIFYDIMIEDGVNKTKAKIMYLAVKWFGLKKWRD